MTEDRGKFCMMCGEHAPTVLVVTANIDAHFATLGLNSQSHTGQHIAAEFNFEAGIAVLVNADKNLARKGF